MRSFFLILLVGYSCVLTANPRLFHAAECPTFLGRAYWIATEEARTSVEYQRSHNGEQKEWVVRRSQARTLNYLALAAQQDAAIFSRAVHSSSTYEEIRKELKQLAHTTSQASGSEADHQDAKKYEHFFENYLGTKHRSPSSELIRNTYSLLSTQFTLFLYRSLLFEVLSQALPLERTIDSASIQEVQKSLKGFHQSLFHSALQGPHSYFDPVTDEELRRLKELTEMAAHRLKDRTIAHQLKIHVQASLNFLDYLMANQWRPERIFLVYFDQFRLLREEGKESRALEPGKS